MSQTEAIGIADAARWVGVAASMVGYLDPWLAEAQALPVPRGIFAGARRFLNQALEGIALDRRERVQPEIPIMAGISNLTIAIGVMRRLARPENPAEVETQVKQHLACLQAIEAGQPRSEEFAEKVRALKDFFSELRGLGNRARHRAFALEAATSQGD